METIIDNITQRELAPSLANEKAESKIKLRASSYANSIRHVKNIPYKAVKESEIKSSKFHFPIQAMKMNVLPHKSMDTIVESQKLINVKEDKIENIRKHADILISMAIDEQKLEQDNIISTQLSSEKIDNIQPKIMQDNSLSEFNGDNNSMNKDNVVDINEYITKLNNETQLVKNVKQEALLAQQEANLSDENVSKLSVEVSELEKQEAAVEKQNIELDRKVIEAYESQTRTLAMARQEYQDLIIEANERKQNNENKIIQFQSKIDKIRNHITDVNESIAKKQEILAAVQQTEFPDTNNLIQFPNINETIQLTANDEEEKVKKIA